MLRTGFLSKNAAGTSATAVVRTDAVTALIPAFTDSLKSEGISVFSGNIMIAVFITVPFEISIPENELRLKDLPVIKRVNILPDADRDIHPEGSNKIKINMAF